MSDPIRIFVGTEPKTLIAQKVLEHSIRRHTKATVEITPMVGLAWEYPAEGIKVGTGFSLRRWMIPKACNFQGRAIYMDADQLVFGDVAELFGMLKANPIATTWQPDKYSPKVAVPQTSVMVMDCEAFRGVPFGLIDEILKYLREHTSAQAYGALMHAEWLRDAIGTLPVEWNHLNAYQQGKTKLLHYTKEPEQPWYKPEHPLAYLWQEALKLALADGAVTTDEIRLAIQRWGIKEDWRPTNGLHPYYKRFIARPKATKVVNHRFAESAPKLPDQRVLWVTTFGADMFEPSGKPLIQSFLEQQPVGDMLIAAEGVSKPQIAELSEKLLYHDLDKDTFLSDWLEKNSDVIPKHLGGHSNGTCRCPGGPFDVHDKRHRMPCIGHWFNRNASRWFRKIAAQRAALAIAELNNYDVLIWVDADCRFKKTITASDVQSFFKGAKNAAFYLRHKRPIMEAGILGFHLRRKGQTLIQQVVDCYRTGAFRKLKRWDDSAVYQHFVDRLTIPAIDVAYGVGDHAAVVPHSVLGAYLEHMKGKHGRGLGLMT